MRKTLKAALLLALCLGIATGARAGGAAPNGKSLNSLARSIALSCTHSGMTQYEKAMALYDWLIDHTDYRGDTTDAYRVLRDGEASCGGYANAYQALLRQVGIQSRPVYGRIYSIDHVWNLVKLGGKWYHADARMGDHLGPGEGRYRRFALSDEQMRVEYNRFGNPGAKSYAENYAYKTGALTSAIAHMSAAINARAALGERVFALDFSGPGAPPELSDPFNRITVKVALQNQACFFPGLPDVARAQLSIAGDQLLVRLRVPRYRVSMLTHLIPVEINQYVPGGDFRSMPVLALGDKVLVEPTHATNPKLFWKSYRERVATVDQMGNVTLVGYGAARIRILTTDGSGKSISYHLYVRPQP